MQHHWKERISSNPDVLAALAFSADVMRRKPYIAVTEVEESAGRE